MDKPKILILWNKYHLKLKKILKIKFEKKSKTLKLINMQLYAVCWKYAKILLKRE